MSKVVRRCERCDEPLHAHRIGDLCRECAKEAVFEDVFGPMNEEMARQEERGADVDQFFSEAAGPFIAGRRFEKDENDGKTAEGKTTEGSAS
jgi:hypothetical protein